MVTDDPWIMPPTLHGRNLVLCPVSMDDLNGLAQPHKDVDTPRFLPCGIESEPPSERSVAYPLRLGQTTITQVDAQTAAIVGTTARYNMSKMHGRVMVEYHWLCSTVRGSATNPESKSFLLGHIFNVLGARRTEFNLDDRNVPSRVAVPALGAKEEGCLRKHARRCDGSLRTIIVHSVIDSECPTVRAGLRARIQPTET